MSDMKILPKSSKEFSSKEYWDSFFTKREKNFEWYGNFYELISLLSKYVRKIDQILIVGCGNSRLSVDMFDVADYKNIISIDISEIVIKQMISQHQRERPELKFLVMDATKLQFDNDHFSVIIDKGTLDALMTNQEPETVQTVLKYFEEVKRVLKQGGRFIIISLLQEHIVDLVLDYFSSNNFFIRIVRCLEAEAKSEEVSENGTSLPTFMIIATKFLKLPQKIFELSVDGNVLERFSSLESFKEPIMQIQKTAMIRNGLVKNINNKEEVHFDLFSSDGKIPRFSMYIVDCEKGTNKNQYACFICPLGREHEWLFSTNQGRLKLLSSSGCDRLAIVLMHRNQNYSSMDDIKVELENTVKTFAPRNLKNTKIPFLTLGSDIGKRQVVHSGSSEFSGDFVIEDVTIESKKTFRRLVFLNNQFVVQSEALMRRGKNKKHFTVDHGYLACNHHLYMISGILAAHKIKKNKKCSEVLVIGLGAGGLTNYIHDFIKEVNTTVVEIDEKIYEAAKKYFGVIEDKKLKVVIEDGIIFLKNSATNDKKFSSILFDVDSKDTTIGMSCPPKEFVESEILEAVKSSLTEDGIFVLNLVCRDEKLRKNVVENLKKSFESIFSYQLDEDVNEIFYCHNIKGLENFKDFVKKASTDFNSLMKQENQDNSIDIEELMEQIKIN